VIAEQLPVLVVVTPLLGALVTMFVGGRTRAWAWAMAVVAATFGLTVALVIRVMTESPAIEYHLGNWPPEYGIGYRVDELNAIVLLIIATVGLVTTFYARLSVADEIRSDTHHIFYTIWLLALMGMMGMTITGDAFNVYVLLEISALTIYTLIAMGKDRDRRALVAAIRYLILGSIGATFILVGIGFLLMRTGTLNMVDMHEQLRVLADEGALLGDRTVLVAFAFLLVGMGLKMALFPLHMWLPKAYAYAPSAVSAMLAATATKVGVYVGIRFLLTVFGFEFSFAGLPSHQILLLCAGAGVIWCSLKAIRAENVKLLLAWSSVAQIGYMVLGFALHNGPGVAGSVVHLFNHAMTKGAMFLAVGCVIYRLGGCRVEHLRGLGRRMPWTMAAFTVGGMGLIGFPLTAGFISKWYLLQGCIEAGMWLYAGVIVIGSLLAVVYVWRLVEKIYFQQPTVGAAEGVREAPATMVIATWVLAAASVYFGIDAQITGTLATGAAQELLPADAWGGIAP